MGPLLVVVPLIDNFSKAESLRIKILGESEFAAMI